MCEIFSIFCRSSFIKNFIMKILILLFFGALKSRKLKYLETHLFKKNFAHRFEDHICTNKLEEFFCRKCFFQRLAAFFTTAKPLIWASFFPTKNQFHTFFQVRLFNFNALSKTCFKNFFEK